MCSLLSKYFRSKTTTLSPQLRHHLLLRVTGVIESPALLENPIMPLSNSILMFRRQFCKLPFGVVSKEELLREGLQPELMPKHVAVIPDGNRRWAKERGLSPEKGHEAGKKVLGDLCRYCSKWGIKVLSAYAFSTENWSRPKVGPVGGQEGTVWDEKGKNQIAKIFLSYDGNSICSLQFLFVDNDNFVLSDIHGAAHNKNFTTVVLDYPSEYLTWIEGSCETNTIRSSINLRSIIFGTNKGSYGPYGCIRINPSVGRTVACPPIFLSEFKFEIGDDRSFGGCHGTKTDKQIEIIGVYVKTVTSSMIRPRDSRVKVKREEEED